jgi:hypothetical protein
LQTLLEIKVYLPELVEASNFPLPCKQTALRSIPQVVTQSIKS